MLAEPLKDEPERHGHDRQSSQPPHRRVHRLRGGASSAVIACLYVALVAAPFVYFWPVFTGQPLSHAEWLQRMWFPSWF